jgi:hypothetical protein
VYGPKPPAPDAVSEVDVPIQIAAGVGTDTLGIGFTVTVTFAVLLHPVVGAVPVTVYSVVDVGLAVTVAPVLADNPVIGDQANVLDAIDELAVKLTELPLQMAGVVGVTNTVGLGLMVMRTDAELAGHGEIAGKLYVKVTVPPASDVGDVYKPEDVTPIPDQVPPEGVPVNCKVAPPAQTDCGGPALTVGAWVTVTGFDILAVHPGKPLTVADKVTV